MHSARRVALVVGLSLLASVASASAECAWVLWNEATDMQAQPIKTTWTPLQGFVTSATCNAEATKSRQQDKRGTDSHMMRVLRCLPDTVDPREPKGK
jgi:hypothetical protein